MQGWKSGVIIFGIALVLHALVAVTGTLVIAMGVHTAYDLIVLTIVSRTRQRWEHEDAAAAAG